MISTYETKLSSPRFSDKVEQFETLLKAGKLSRYEMYREQEFLLSWIVDQELVNKVNAIVAEALKAMPLKHEAIPVPEEDKDWLTNETYIPKKVYELMRLTLGRDLYNEWKLELIRQHPKGAESILSEDLEGPAHETLICTFSWDHSEQGYDFWFNIYNKLKRKNK